MDEPLISFLTRGIPAGRTPGGYVVTSFFPRLRACPACETRSLDLNSTSTLRTRTILSSWLHLPLHRRSSRLNPCRFPVVPEPSRVPGLLPVLPEEAILVRVPTPRRTRRPKHPHVRGVISNTLAFFTSVRPPTTPGYRVCQVPYPVGVAHPHLETTKAFLSLAVGRP